MNAFASGGEWEDESRVINTLLHERRVRLRFPVDFIEGKFRDEMRDRALLTVRQNYWLIFAFYLLIGVLTHFELKVLSAPQYLHHDMIVWWSVYFAESVVVGSLIGCALWRRLDRHYWTYMTSLGVLAVTAITVATSAFDNPYFNQHSSYVIIFILMIIYGVANLRLVQAFAISLAGGLLSLGAILGYGLHLDWGQFGQYFVMANLVGMGVSYVLERRDRTMFLQARLLELEKHQLNVLSQRLDQLSREDALTGLANRRHFNETLQREWERARRDQTPMSLVFIDIDHFKPYNDHHGHLDGDRALASIGAALRQCVRRSGDIAARYGGEEFVLLLPNTAADGAREVAKQVLKAVDDLRIPHGASTVAPHITASIGVATHTPTAERSASYLIAGADAAVYTAKAAGRHRIIVNTATEV